MSVLGLLMAGGRSERMRAGGNATHKTLRRVGGASLLRHNLEALFAARVDRIAIAISSAEPALQDYVENDLLPRCRERATPCEIVVEDRPLGNVGAAQLVARSADHILIDYADNLTALDLGRLTATHIASGRSATIATHVETFCDPYGELTLEGDDVVGYAEKPIRHTRVSSGTCVLTQAACTLIPVDVPTAAHELFALLRARGERVGAYRHAAPWVDVNDEPSIERAERMVDAHPLAFSFEHR